MNRKALVIGFLLMCGPVLRAHAAGEDCAPLGHLPNYEATGDAERYEYQGAEFIVPKGDETQPVTVAGSYCKRSYGPKEGTEQMSDLEILMNYRTQLAKLGASILSRDDSNVYAKLVRNGQETWMHVYSGGGGFDVTVVDKHAPKQVLSAPTGKDYPLLGHMPGYEVGSVEKHNFDQLDYDVRNGDDSHAVTVQGAKYVVTYSLKDGARSASDLAILENYRAALAGLGRFGLHPMAI